MVKKKSRMTPQHRHWYEDLPGRDVPMDRVPQMVHGDVNSMGDVFLEVSRASTLMRGAGVMAAFIVLFGGVVGLIVYVFLFFPMEYSFNYFFPFIVVSILLVCSPWVFYYFLSLDCAISKDRPIRFNRSRNKVYVYEHSHKINPFISWPVTLKEFDWNTLHAEIHRQAGSNGKVYIQRFAVWLVSVKPGTDEVVDRFELKGNSPTREELYNIWAYCRQYMEQGPAGLPSYPPRRQGITFRRSFFEYMRFLDPTQEGREERQQMNAFEWVINVIVFVTAFWLLIPLGVCHYIAMRFAPDVNWPPEIDAESRSA